MSATAAAGLLNEFSARVTTAEQKIQGDDGDLTLAMPTSTLTSREREFITSLRTNWRRLYLGELGRRLKQEEACDDGHECRSIIHPSFLYGCVRSSNSAESQQGK